MYRLIELPTPGASALAELRAGLARKPRELPAKYFYDAAGSALFDRICELPEYYLTRAELQLMERHVGDIAAFIGCEAQLIEFGCGSGRKTRLLIESLRPASFVPVDISRSALESACTGLAGDFPDLDITAINADYTRPIDIAALVAARPACRTVYFPGSTVGNFDRMETMAFLGRIRGLVGAGGTLVIGVDCKNSPDLLHAAYNDSAGVTAAFNLNLLTHVNREFGANFELGGFEHVAFYDEERGRVEMHLLSLRSQKVSLGGTEYHFNADELLRTEISCKYAIDEFQDMARACGYAAERVWCDEGGLFAVHGLRVSS